MKTATIRQQSKNQGVNLAKTIAVSALLITAQSALGQIMIVDDDFDNGNPLTNNQGGYVLHNTPIVSESGGQLTMTHGTDTSGSTFGTLVSNDPITWQMALDGPITVELTIDSTNFTSVDGASRVWVGLTGKPGFADTFTDASESFIAVHAQADDGLGSFRFFATTEERTNQIIDGQLLDDIWDSSEPLTIRFQIGLNFFSIEYRDGNGDLIIPAVSGATADDFLEELFLTNNNDLAFAEIFPAFGMQNVNSNQDVDKTAVFSHFQAAAVPEPGIMMLLLIAATGLLARRRRFRG